MAIGLSEPLIGHYLDEAGVLQLGGEARMVRYELLDEPKILPKGKSGWIMALNSFPYAMLAAQGFEGLPRCSGPLTRMGGWDMQKGFHKDMTAFLPAGTVIKVEEERPIPFGFIRI
jgi:CRISPR-associated protein Cmr3